MRRSLLGLLGTSSALLACASAEPPPLPPVVQVPAAPPPAPPPAPPSLLVLPRAEASPRRVPHTPERDFVELRAEGKGRVLQRTLDGLVLISAERGVLGVLAPPALDPIFRWVGFLAGDAILAVVGDTLYRADTPEEALAGKLAPIANLDPALTRFASAGKIVVAAAPGPEGVYYESRDGGSHFHAAKRPGKGPLVDFAVRFDGVIVAAVEKERVRNADGNQGIHAAIFSSKSAGAWVAGPIAEAFYGSPLTQRGDSIVVLSPTKKSDEPEPLGLDAKGRWILTDFPDLWLPLTGADSQVDINAPTVRPGFPEPGRGGGGLLGGIMGMGTGSCSGVDCLARRALLGPPPIAAAFHDGVCSKDGVQAHTETFPGQLRRGKTTSEHTYTTYDCDPRAPAQRASTLVLRDGLKRPSARLPATCASGEVTGSGPFSFVYCDAKHRGRPSFLHVSPAGVLTEVASGVAGDLNLKGAESASDGTTLIFANEGAWICTVSGAPCVAVPPEHFLAARPLPGGRALVARRAGDHELQIEIAGEASAEPLRIAVEGNALEIEVTAEGNVRLWTSVKATRLDAPESMARLKGDVAIEAFRVRVDGHLVPDAEAKASLQQEVAATRSAR